MTLSVPRETVLSALYTKLCAAQFSSPVNGSSNFVTTSRRLLLWADVDRTARPAMFMTDHHETPIYRSENVPAIMNMLVDVFVYIDSKDPTVVPSTAINVILDALDAAIAPGPGEQRQTLGGLVSHCRVEGQTLKDPGDLDGDGLIVMPIRIMLT